MAKKILIGSLLFAIAFGGLAFGSGQSDSTPNIPGPATTGDKLTLSGTVKVENLIHPVLSSGGKEYYLMVPRFLLNDVVVKDGAQVKIEGYQTTNTPRFSTEAKGTYILVTKATVDGKDYDLTVENGGKGMMGDRGGMMSGGRGSMMGGRGRGR
jgi:hypothetical protein